MGWHLPLHGVATFSKTEMQHSPKMPATFSKKNLQETLNAISATMHMFSKEEIDAHQEIR